MPSNSPLLPAALLAALPVAEVLPALLEALSQRPNAVLVAPPGAGKTTLVPLALHDAALHNAAWLGDQRIVMLEPRRLAARAAAQRMAALIGQQAGELVGYRTRIDSAVSDRTRIEVVTEGLLVRRLLSDPTLDGVGCVIFDEVHERGLDADLAMAFCLDLQRNLRPELRLLAMSATADGAALSRRLEAPVIESAGRLFPVEIRHAARDPLAVRDLPEMMARAIRTALADTAAPVGDVLAFLPGVGEIRRTAAALAGVDADILPLHGEMPPAEQDHVLRPETAGRRRRVVLATSIAETSLTVPGVRIVVDGGYRRAPRLDAGSGLSRLETMRISRAAAAQRAGRAGREAPGLAIRLWTEATGRGLAVHDRPEILDAELAGFRLDASAWAETMGTAPSELPLPDPPPEGANQAARALLTDLGALDAQDAITGLGRRMAQLGAHPRLAAMMLAARDPAEAALAADLAALLEERDPLRPRSGNRGPGSRMPDAPADVGLRLSLLAGGEHPDADRASLARIRQSANTYRRRLGTRAPPGGDVGALLAAAFPDRIAQRRGEVGAFRLSGGGSARLARTDDLADAALLVAAALQVRAAPQIRLAARLDPEALPASLLARATEQVENALDPVSGSVVSRRRLRLGALVLRDRTLTAEPQEIGRLLLSEAAGRLRTALTWSDAACQFQARVALARDLGLDASLREQGQDGLPDLSDAALVAGIADWLLPAAEGMTRLSELSRLDLLPLLRARLGFAQASLIDRELPSHLSLPGGRAAIDYTGPVPQAAARAQAFYGLRETPRLAGGRARLRLALLSPAGRPAAITGDLAGFWKGAWVETRHALRGRYPRHDWPEDPGEDKPR